MGFSGWSWLAALSCFFCMAGEVRCDCTEDNMNIIGGNYTLTRELAIGSMLIYRCKDGWYPYPARIRICQLNGSWNPPPIKSKPQECRLVECPDPNVMEYGDVYPPMQRYYVHNETTYECYAGYTLRGSSTRVCLPHGKWSGQTPVCTRDLYSACGDPGIPPGASRSGNSFDIDDTVTYTCNSRNLFLVGSKVRKCQENRQWTGKEPACYYTYTYDTTLEVSQAFGSALTETLTILDTDEAQMGRSIRISKDGILNIYIAVDISESIEKKHLNAAKTAIATLIEKIASFSVTPNYEIIFFSSEIFEVVNIIEFMDDRNRRTPSKTSIIDKVRSFEVGEKNTAGTDVNLAYKTILERMALIKERVKMEVFKEHRHVIIVFTDGAYNMGGSPLPTVTKIKNMVYMNQTGDDENQPRRDFLDMYVFAIGEVILDADLQPLTTQKTGEKHYFRLTDITTLHDTFDLIIDESQVQGLCGLHKFKMNNTDSYFITKDNVRSFYPWYATITVQNGRNKCFGSLVSPDFILTAAHCFKFGDLAEDIRVQINDGEGKEKKVRQFYLHPDYNVGAKVKEGVQEFYDYDIALIQLEKPVVISANVRPICIPCTNETSNALQLVGNTTCKQQEEILLKTHLEPLTFLSRSSDVVKEKDVFAKLGDNRDNCIKEALNAPGITTKDPRVPVTDNFLCTGGGRDDKSCKGDSGGAVFKNYEYRTIQIGVVSWGTSECDPSKKDKGDFRDFHINLFKVVPFLRKILGDDTKGYTSLTFLEK